LAVPSPDGRRAALVAPRSTALRLYEGVRLGRLVGLGGAREEVRLILWTGPDRLVAIVQRMSLPYARYVRARYAVGVDAAHGRVLFRTRFDQRLSLTGSGGSRGRAVLLYQSSTLLARRARVTVVSADGAVRSAQLRFEVPRTTHVFAGLAVDPASPRAYAVLTGGRVAAIDLRRLSVAYHAVPALPAGSASKAPFVLLRAATAGRHSLVVSGLVTRSRSSSERPAGITILDTRTWRARVVDRRAARFAVVGDIVVTANPGVTAYGIDGSRRYHLLGTGSVSALQIIRGRAYAWIGTPRPVALGAAPPARVVSFGPRSGVVFGRATVDRRIRVVLLDPNGY
jgi:hypothetical protein